MPGRTKSQAAGNRQLSSIEDAAAYLGVHPLTVRRAIAAGRLKAYKLGPRLIRVDMAEVDAMLEPIPAAGGAA